MTRPARLPLPEPVPLPAPPPRRVAIFADVNPNLIDGSTIWLQSLARAFAGIPGAEVTLVLRDPLATDVVLAPARAAGARLVTLDELAPDGRDGGRRDRAADRGLWSGWGGAAGFATGPATGAAIGAEERPRRLVAAFEALDARAPHDLFVVRGRSFIEAAARTPGIAPRLWAYWLDRPDIVHPAADPLAAVAPLVERIVVQSALAAALLETVFRVPAERILVLPPMVPEEAFAERPAERAADAPAGAPVRLVYSGKIDRSYNVEAFLGLPALLAGRGIEAAVTVVGDKFNAAAEDPGFRARMEAALAATPGVAWERGVARARALELMAAGDFGLCWRNPRHDNSLEVSTKLLEFAALGVPPLLNRTAIHARLLGADYPFFVKDPEGIAEAVARGRADAALLAATAPACARPRAPSRCRRRGARSRRRSLRCPPAASPSIGRDVGGASGAGGGARGPQGRGRLA